MIAKFLPLLFLYANVAFAQNQNLDWLPDYLKMKSIKCQLTQEQIRAQLSAEADRSVEQIAAVLRDRSSEVQSAVQDREALTIGKFPNVPVFDFFALAKVNIVIRDLNFQIQTTLFTEQGSSVQSGLWLPFTVRDPGPGKPCALQRITVSEDQRRFLPVVDLIYGNPPRVVTSRLIDVVDVANSSAPAGPSPQTQAPPPQQSAPPPKTNVDEEKAEAKPRREERRESRRERRRREREERRQSRREEARQERNQEERDRRRQEREERRQERRKARRQRAQQPPPEPPDKRNECSGDLSGWAAIKCAVTGGK